jgi:hypothetical protein
MPFKETIIIPLYKGTKTLFEETVIPAPYKWKKMPFEED